MNVIWSIHTDTYAWLASDDNRNQFFLNVFFFVVIIYLFLLFGLYFSSGLSYFFRRYVGWTWGPLWPAWFVLLCIMRNERVLFTHPKLPIALSVCYCFYSQSMRVSDVTKSTDIRYRMRLFMYGLCYKAHYWWWLWIIIASGQRRLEKIHACMCFGVSWKFYQRAVIIEFIDVSIAADAGDGGSFRMRQNECIVFWLWIHNFLEEIFKNRSINLPLLLSRLWGT